MRHDKGDIAVIICAICVILALALTGVFGPNTATKAPQLAAPPPQYVFSAVATAYGGERLFCLGAVNYIVHSAHTYEDGLLQGSISTDDVDYMLGYGNQYQVCLPGGSWNHYVYLGAVFVTGSGTVLCFIAPNGGHFCFLHIAYPPNVGLTLGSIRPAIAPAYQAPTLPQGQLVPEGDDNTAQAITKVFGSDPWKMAPTLTTIAGGTRIGWSRWPDSTLFGNGSCCQQDAHLCLLLDAAAEQWFIRILQGLDKRPKPPKPTFPTKKWCAWASGHHKPCPAHQDGHKRLVWSASWWFSHHLEQRLKGKRSGNRWYGPKKGRKYGYDHFPFSKGALDCWPHYKTCKVA